MNQHFRWVVCLMVLFLGFVSPLSAQEESDTFWEDEFFEEEPLTRLEQAQEHVKNLEWGEAVPLFLRIIEDPLDKDEYEQALLGLASSYEAQGNLEKAVRYYKILVRQARDPKLKEDAKKKITYYEEYVIGQFHIGEWVPKKWFYELTSDWAKKYPEYEWHFRQGLKSLILIFFKFLLLLVFIFLVLIFSKESDKIKNPFDVQWGLSSIFLIYSTFLILQSYLVYLLKPSGDVGQNLAITFDVISILSYLILTAIILLFLTYRGVRWRKLGFDVHHFGHQVVLALKYIVFLLIFFGIYAFLRSHDVIEQDKIIRSYPLTSIGGALHFFQFLLLVIIAPICEEVFYRGYIYPVVRNRTGILMGIVLTSLFFALVHVQSFLVLFSLSVALCFLYEKNRSLIPPILVHAFYNFLVRFGGNFLPNP